VDGPGVDPVSPHPGNSIVLHMSVSLDGFMEGPGHDIGWHQVDGEVHQHINDVLRSAGAFLQGRVAYELMDGFWPTADSHPDSSPEEVDFSQIWRDVPKVVYSRTLAGVGGTTRVFREVVAAEVEAVRAKARGDLYVGGARLAAEFLRQDLVDEFRLFVNPVLLGEGTPLFPQLRDRRELRLVESRTFGNGVVLLRHARARSDGRA
jgi:dihydrofolate reductase